jgi:hypothetical protein
MTEMSRSFLYPGSSINILTPQLQVPMQFDPLKFYMEDAKKESLMSQGFFINFNARSELHQKRRPIRNHYIYRGTNQLQRKEENPRMFDENL